MVSILGLDHLWSFLFCGLVANHLQISCRILRMGRSCRSNHLYSLGPIQSIKVIKINYPRSIYRYWLAIIHQVCRLWSWGQVWLSYLCNLRCQPQLCLPFPLRNLSLHYDPRLGMWVFGSTQICNLWRRWFPIVGLDYF